MTSPKKVLKLDISMAYDRVELSERGYVKVRVYGGLGDSNYEVRDLCLIFCFVEGQPIGNFRLTRGIWQGDPLSPYLFLFVSEGLSGLLHHADSMGLIQEKSVPLKQCLLLYEHAAGQHINFQKSALSFGPKTDGQVMNEIKDIMNVPIVDFHVKYLGFPTTIGRNKKEVFRKINERLDFHLQGWQEKFLSKAGLTPSAIWRGLLWGKQVNDTGIRWRIGNRRRVSIVSDRWLPCLIGFKVVSPVSLPRHQKVESLFMASGAWDVPLLKSIFLPHEADMILSMPIGLRTVPDKLVWHFTKTRVYTVKSGYWVARDMQNRKTGPIASTSHDDNKKLWSRLWSLNIPHKECPGAKGAWKKSFLKGVHMTWQEHSFFDLLYHVHLSATEHELATFCYIAWWIWRNRILHRHREKSMGPGELFEVAVYWQIEYERNCFKVKDITKIVSSNRVSWKPPHEGSLKMNFNGACDVKNGLYGLGVIFRDSQGAMKGAMAVPQVGNLPPRSVEALALLHGLRFALHVGFLNIEVEGDALSVINSFMIVLMI
ncbi:uncharacterized protein LOC133730441 [Rosa rugosa]|uniref:uncharacterized protein LOC133730441 n=1 Tax=Rosa rugosa TaxID=74645 RepID=UPI002B40FD18|nr:uncharacterized protein LOC133730441 [Rosa rugosa]